MRVALLEDDIDQARLLRKWLIDAGHICEHFDAGRTFVRQVKRESFDLLLLDWLLPEMSGLEVLDWVRENLDWRIPIIFITTMDREEDIVRALEHGADDYITKPVREREMLARISAVARRALQADEAKPIIDLDPYVIDQEHRTITRGGAAIDLTQKEYELAAFLFRNVGRVLSRGYILQNVWGRNPDINTRTVDTHVSRIRSKLGIAPESGWKLTSVYQHGYRLEQTGDAAEAAG
ncbi:MAG: response regulator transcription factor [Gammaproteobacteria bacterium]